MEKVMSVNDFIGCLPKIPSLHRWEVFYNGEYRGKVRAIDKVAAYGFLPVDRFPNREKIQLLPLSRGSY